MLEYDSVQVGFDETSVVLKRRIVQTKTRTLTRRRRQRRAPGTTTRQMRHQRSVNQVAMPKGLKGRKGKMEKVAGKVKVKMKKPTPKIVLNIFVSSVFGRSGDAADEFANFRNTFDARSETFPRSERSGERGGDSSEAISQIGNYQSLLL